MAKKRIRILTVISDLSGGGAERVVSTILQNIDHRKFELMLCLWRMAIDYPVPDYVSITVLGKDKPWHIFRAIWRTRLLIKKWKPDLVYSHLSYVNILTGLCLFGMNNPPVWIPCQHTNPFLTIGPIMKILLGIILNRSNKVIAVSNGVRDACIKKFLLPKEKVITI